MADFPKLRFIGIGISKYSYFDPLPNAVRDVTAMARLMEKRFGADSVELLLDGQASTTALTDLFEDLPDRIGVEDSLIIYYAGHGKPGRNNKSYWLPSDAKPGNRNARLRTGTVRDMLADVSVKHLLVLCDSCFSGGLVTGGYRSALSDENRNFSKRRSRWIICSGASDQVVVDGQPGTHSPFASEMLRILSDPEETEIRVSTLADRLRQGVGRFYAQDITASPMPLLGDNNGMFVFRAISEEEKVWKRALVADSVKHYRAYLERFPQGLYVLAARRKLRPTPNLIAPPPALKEPLLTETKTYVRFSRLDWCTSASTRAATFAEAQAPVDDDLRLPPLAITSPLIASCVEVKSFPLAEELPALRPLGYLDEFGQLIGSGNLSAFWVMGGGSRKEAYGFFYNHSLGKAYLRKVNKDCRLSAVYIKSL